MTFSHLERPVQFLSGVGPRRAEALGRMGIVTAADLLFHTPRRYDDASTVEPISALEVGMDTTVVGRVRSVGVIPTRKRLRIFQAVLEDGSGMITAAWPGQPWLERKIRKGDTVLVTGPVRFFHGRQIQPREFSTIGRGSEGDSAFDLGAISGTVFVSYPASDDVPQWVLRGIFERNLDALLPRAEEFEYLDSGLRSELRLLSLPDALRHLHRPESIDDAEVGRKRLAFDELFFLQLVQAKVRYEVTRAHPGIVFGRSNELIRPLHESLPFELTSAQTGALQEIYADMTSERRMHRLLQGDVGAGKTLVAFFATVLAVESGWQVALMAPTEILAEQHLRSAVKLLEPLEIDVALLTGKLSTAERRGVLDRVASGEADVVIGTHALIQDSVNFRRLGLVVVDEQHRFGVRQRLALTERARSTMPDGVAAQESLLGSDLPPDARDPDVLIMSATPIPRSLAMTAYGDLDLTVLDELPPGRRPVTTTLRYPAARPKVYDFVESELEKGRQAFVVYPLVEESEKVDLRSAKEEFDRLREEVFPRRSVGLVHGRLGTEEKDRVMRAFRDGEIDLLVATTVIEVGIDVPNATVMVIEHAERFGLSQLHQLRGRVGRGGEQSTCILISEPGEQARERLEIFTRTHDGFEIAHADLEIRGQGDLFGAQQHGKDPFLRFADLSRDEGALVQAQRLARSIIDLDPELARPGHHRMKELLHRRYRDRMELFGTG